MRRTIKRERYLYSLKSSDSLDTKAVGVQITLICTSHEAAAAEVHGPRDIALTSVLVSRFRCFNLIVHGFVSAHCQQYRRNWKNLKETETRGKLK